MDHLEPFVATAKHLNELAEAVAKNTTHDLKVLNLGGGLGIPFHTSDQFPTVAAFKASLQSTLLEKYEYWYEPGQSLVGSAVGLLGSIVAKKMQRGREWAIADIGCDQILKFAFAFLGLRLPIMGPYGPVQSGMGGTGAIGGPLCFSGDTLITDVEVSEIQPGDPIFIQHAGAYCGATSSTFNGRRSGGTFVLRSNGILIRVQPPGEVAQEPLAWGYTWGAMASAQAIGESD